MHDLYRAVDIMGVEFRSNFQLAFVVFVLVVAVLAQQAVVDAGEATNAVPYVAFVFAGSARTFARPIIHLSIKNNLIQGFCPPETCEHEIFVRMSIADNTHISEANSPINNAVGRLIPKNAEREESARRAVQALGDANRIHLTFSEIGSKEEAAAMDAFAGPIDPNRTDFMLKVYRDLDPRRFNMYYNRWEAYNMAKAHEAIVGRQFDCVVHARLDFVWGYPVRPIQFWDMKRLWVPDQWGTDVPDTFSLIPRKFSDVYYSLHAMYVPQGPKKLVACLGGPNFDPDTVTDEYLIAAGYEAREARALIQSELCLNKFPDVWQHVNKIGVKWSWAGLSEMMLKRKLVVQGINLGQKTLGFSSFFGFITRFPFEIRCAEQEPSAFIAWAQEFYQPSLAFAYTCHAMNLELSKNFNSNPKKSVQRERHCQKQFNFNSPSYMAQEPVCLLDDAITGWNFMPYRVRTDTGVCWTLDIHATSKGNASSDVCVDCVRTTSCHPTTIVQTMSGRETYYMHYRTSQLFKFYPSHSQPQQVWNVHYQQQHIQHCLTVVTRHVETSSKEEYIIQRQQCKGAVDKSIVNQLFIVKDISSDGAQDASTISYKNSTSMRATGPTYQFMWVMQPQKQQMCVNNQFLDQSGSGYLNLIPCMKDSSQPNPTTVFIGERSINTAPTSY
jgi:hypothetical protein